MGERLIMRNNGTLLSGDLEQAIYRRHHHDLRRRGRPAEPCPGASLSQRGLLRLLGRPGAESEQR